MPSVTAIGYNLVVMPTWTKISFDDDLDLGKIARSGQAFRMEQEGPESFSIIASHGLLRIRETPHPGEFEVDCTQEDWDELWLPYFDGSRNYRSIRERAAGKNAFIDESMGYSKGLRILDQDPWEMLITFIVSQRKSIPAIKGAVNAICQRFGCEVGSGEDAHFAFPDPSALASASEEELRQCSVGYRAPYIMDAAQKVARGDISLEALAELPDEELLDALKQIHGVGDKVARCVMLFGYGRTSSVPVDVWIARAIDEECDGEEPFSEFGEDAGIIQQYVFHYMTNRGKDARD